MFKVQRLITLLVCATWFFAAQAEIIEIKTVGEIVKHVERPDVFVVWDIDNVVAYPVAGVGGYGSDEWWMAMLDAEKAQGMSLTDAVKKNLPLLYTAYMSIDLKPVEAQTSVLIKSLQSRGIQTIALTARSPQFAERTVKQLASIDVDFAKTALTTKMQEALLPDDTRYHNGMFFCGMCDKGKALIRLFDVAAFKPKKVIFIDDKHKNLANVETALQGRGIQFTGLRYGYLDQDVAAFFNKAEGMIK